MQVSRFVRETLEAYASEALADGIVRRAMSLAGVDALPTTSAELGAFVDGHLLDVTREALGYEQADAVQAQLQGLVYVVAQMERAQGAAPAACPVTARPAPMPAARDDRDPTVEMVLRPFSVVLVLGKEPDVVARMRPHLDKRTAVIPVQDAAVLLRDLRLLRQQPRLLIVDQRRPHDLLDAVRAEPELLERAAVVLWGAKRELEDDVRRSFPKATIVRCGPEASVEDLASIVRLGPGR